MKWRRLGGWLRAGGTRRAAGKPLCGVEAPRLAVPGWGSKMQRWWAAAMAYGGDRGLGGKRVGGLLRCYLYMVVDGRYLFPRRYLPRAIAAESPANPPNQKELLTHPLLAKQ